MYLLFFLFWAWRFLGVGLGWARGWAKNAVCPSSERRLLLGRFANFLGYADPNTYVFYSGMLTPETCLAAVANFTF